MHVTKGHSWEFPLINCHLTTLIRFSGDKYKTQLAGTVKVRIDYVYGYGSRGYIFAL